jgi:hypothetical protein
VSIRRTIIYGFGADTSGLERGLSRAARGFDDLKDEAQRADRALRDIPDNVNVDVDVRTSALEGLRTRLRTQLAQLQRDIAIEPDVDAAGALAQLRRIESQLRQIDRMDAKPEIKIDTDRGIGGFVGTMKSLLQGLVGAATDATGQIGQLFAKLPPQAQAAVAGVGAAIAAASAGLGAIAATGIGGGAVAGGAAFAGFKLLDAYKDYEVAGQRITTVLGDQEGKIRKWADTVSASFGTGSESITRSVAATADLLKPQGFSTREASDYAKEINGVSDALAKWKGADFGETLDVINSALLGETDSLKGYGVDLSAAMVDARKESLKTKDAYKGLNDQQLTSVATLDLIKEKSKDALTAQAKGAGDAAASLAGMKATFENLKDVGIKGIGSIFADIVGDIGRAGGALNSFADAPKDFGKWIEKNREEIRDFFLDIANFAYDAGDAFLSFTETALRALSGMVPMFAEVLGAAANFTGTWIRVVGQTMAPLPGQLGEIGRSLQGQGDALIRMGPQFGEIGRDIQKGMLVAADGVKGLQEKLRPLGDTLRNLKGFSELAVKLKQGDIAGAEAEIGKLSRERLVQLQATIDDNTENKAERRLETLARRREAQLLSQAMGLDLSERQLNRLARRRDASIEALLKNYDPTKRRLDDLTRDETKTIYIRSRDIGGGNQPQGSSGRTVPGSQFAPGRNSTDQAVQEFTRSWTSGLRKQRQEASNFYVQMLSDRADFDRKLSQSQQRFVDWSSSGIDATGPIGALLGGEWNERVLLLDKYRLLIKDIQGNLERLPAVSEGAADALDRIGGEISPGDRKRAVVELRERLKELSREAGFTNITAWGVLGISKEEFRRLKSELRAADGGKPGAKSVADEVKKLTGLVTRAGTRVTDYWTKRSESMQARLAEAEAFVERTKSVADAIRESVASSLASIGQGVTQGLDAAAGFAAVESSYTALLDARDKLKKSDAELARLNPRELRDYNDEMAKAQAAINGFTFEPAIVQAERWRAQMDPAKLRAGVQAELAAQTAAAQRFNDSLLALTRAGKLTGSQVAELAAKGQSAAGGLVEAMAAELGTGSTRLTDAFVEQLNRGDALRKAWEGMAKSQGGAQGKIVKDLEAAAVQAQKDAKKATEKWYAENPLKVYAQLVFTGDDYTLTLRDGGPKKGRAPSGRSTVNVNVSGNMVDPVGAGIAVRRALSMAASRDGVASW